MVIERPLDALSEARNKTVMVELKNGKTIRGCLLAFDIHINLVLDGAEELGGGELSRKIGRLLIRGDTVLMVTPSD
ncbi:MAG TPA: small nuclear ribonucleoprotein [archaeon]|nr:small nuclear ribonucleoprotein [archaeon]